MDKTSDTEVDEILSEAGIVEANMSCQEKQNLLRTLRESQKDFCGSSSLSKPPEILPSKYQENASSCSSKTPGTSIINEEQLPVLNESKTGPVPMKKMLEHNSSNYANTNLPLRDKEVPKEPFLKKEAGYSAALAKSPANKPTSITTFRNAPGGPVAVKQTERDLNSSYVANTTPSNDGVWLEKGTNKENRSSTKSPVSPQIEETKPEETNIKETEDTSTKDNINTMHGGSKDRESPENCELPRLNSLVFKIRTPTSHFEDFSSLPRMTGLTREEWVRSASQNLLARKVAQMENRGSKWITLSERSISIATLEQAVAKSLTQPSKDDGNTSPSGNIQNKPKGSSLVENILNNARESSSDEVVILSPESGSVNTEGCDNAVSSESTKEQDKDETPVTSPVGRNDDLVSCDGDTGRRKSARRNKNRRSGPKASVSNDDFSERVQNSRTVGKNSQRDFNASSNCSLLGDNSPADNTEKCPMCQRDFNDLEDLNRHAWACMGASAEGENQVAEQSSDATEPKLRKLLRQTKGGDKELQIIDKMNSLLSRESVEDEGDDHLFERRSSISPRESDSDDDLVIKMAKSSIRKRNVIHSDDEDIPSKIPRK